MTQPPLGSNPSGSGSFEESGPGQPDVLRGSATTPSSAASTTGQAKEVADTAKGEAKQVAGTAVASGKEVAQTAKDEAANVAAETKQQAASLLSTVRTEVTQQAGTSQQRIAEAMHGLAQELGGMASGSNESGPLTDLAQQASRKGSEVADWLQDREPADVVEAVRSYARRRPTSFLALCALAGVLAGRLTRSTVATRTSLDSKDASDGSNSGARDTWQGGAVPVRTAEPPLRPAQPTPYATGVLGATPETSDYPTAPTHDDELSVPGPGYVGTVRTPTDPGGDLTR